MSQATALSSGLKAAGTTAIIARKTILSGLTVISDGTNTATVTVYDNPSTASGTVLAKGVATSTCPTVHLSFPSRVRADTGLTIVVAGTGSGAIVYYEA